MKKGEKLYFLQPLLLSSLVALGMLIGFRMDQRKTKVLMFADDNNGLGIGVVEEVIDEIGEKYLDSVSRNALIDDALHGVMNNLDPHSTYYSTSELEVISNRMNGYYKGIGIETLYINDTLEIIRVLDNSPAQRVNLNQYDRLINIDGIDITNMDYSNKELAGLLHGSKDTLTLKVEKNSVVRNINIEKEIVKVPSIDCAYMITDSTGYIKLNQFTSKVYKEFMLSLEDLVSNNTLRNLIIDVRDNPGGFLPETINILSQLIPQKDRILVTTKGRKQEQLEYKSNGKSFFNINHIAVLINRNSASGSELLAGALQDWDRAVIIGEPSYGKGLVQEQFLLKYGGAIKLTVARYYTPSGKSIQRDYDEDGNYSYQNDSSAISEYKTLELGRPLKESGGIYPDFYVKDQMDASDLPTKKVIEFVALFIQDNNKLLPADFMSLEWNTIRGDLDQAIIAFFENRLNDNDYHAIQIEIIRQKYGVNNEIRYRNRTDSVVIVALEQIDKPDIFK